MDQIGSKFVIYKTKKLTVWTAVINAGNLKFHLCILQRLHILLRSYAQTLSMHLH